MTARSVVLLAAALTMAVVGAAAAAGTAGGAGAAGAGAASVKTPLPITIGSPEPSPSSYPTPKPAQPERVTAAPADRWALLVGITNYRTVADTVGGAADARLVRDVLLRNGWRSDRIRLLVDNDATGAAIADGLTWLASNSSSRTFSLLHYSGHVKRNDGHEFLWPVDNSFIVDTELVRVMRAVAGASWTNMSGCHAGGLVEGLASSRHLVTTSSRKSEKSYENPKTGFSVWSGMLFDEGLRRGHADRDGDGGVSVSEGFNYAAPRAAEFTSAQKPYGAQRPTIAGDSRSLRLDAPRV
ncbi:MAG TPA: caspase family protein [Mycobacteriales bacterium]|nr:caspase family protein [Mycobacteriales bacterium]